MAALIEANIAQLKLRLEERVAHAHDRADWKEMIEDCDIILSHLEKRPIQENGPVPRKSARLADSFPAKTSPGQSGPVRQA
jgi:hypothetical protein